MRSVRAPRSLLSGIQIVGCLLWARAALAEPTADAARADALFREGKALLARHEYGKACPLLSASFELDAGTGVLLALAICHEGEGKLASASREYGEVAARAAAEKRADRERVARERGAALEPRLSTLSIAPSGDAARLEGFAVQRNGVGVEAGSWGVPLPLDGGEYVVEASAPGKKPWSTRVSLAATGDRRTIAVPALEDAPPPAGAEGPQRTVAAVPPAPSLAAPSVAAEPPGKPVVQLSLESTASPAASRMSALRLTGVSLLAASAIGFGVGTFYGLRAMSKNADSKGNCPSNQCNSDGRSDRLAALAAGNASTIAFVAGGVAAATGVTLFVLGGRRNGTSTAGWAGSQARIAFEPGGARFLLEMALEP